MKYLERKKESKQAEFFHYNIIQLFTIEVIRIA